MGFDIANLNLPPLSVCLC